ncbi:MAG: YmdB family metallophosphoesterase [Treponema sp.]|nr:YmdB family metallophosphoesterase [Treponema sp.]
MRILYVAELVGKAGIYALKKALPELKKNRQVDFTLVCADGATGGNGLGRSHAAYIRKLGADALTTGDFCFYKKDLVENWAPYVLRPHNLDPSLPGAGWRVFKTAGNVRVAAAVLLGRHFSRIRGTNPFTGLEGLLEKLRRETPWVILDFHSWASGEKRTLFAAAAGRCTAVIGSHNRVQTADEEILDGTAVICDAGRTGSAESVGGTAVAVKIGEYLTGIPNWTREAWERCELQGLLVETGKEGRALKVERIRVPVSAAGVDTGVSKAGS